MSKKMTTSEPTTARDTNVPTTENIAKALRVCFEKICACSECPFEHESCGDIEQFAADRLESQEREIAEMKAFLEENRKLCALCASEGVIEQKAEVGALTARAERAERERDAAKADMKLIVDAVRETHCDETCCFACKYDCDMSINDSGEFNNECPGFDRDDCFDWRGQPQEGEKE